MNALACTTGPRTQIIGPKYHEYDSILALKPYNLGPWTLRVIVLTATHVVGVLPSFSGPSNEMQIQRTRQLGSPPSLKPNYRV